MKKHLLLALAGLLAAGLPARPATAQTAATTAAPTAGRLTYEVTTHLDPGKARVLGTSAGGQTTDLSAAGLQIQGPDGTMLELPRTTSYQQQVVFDGVLAREDQGSGRQQVVLMGHSGGKAAPAVAPAFTESSYLDAATRTRTAVTTIDGASYALPTRPVPAPPADWRELPQVKRVAGYVCHKATATHEGQPYTLWVTTDLPFTYSPVPGLTPVRGVVLALSGEQQQYTATAVVAEAVPAASLRPAATARASSEAEVQALREQARSAAQQRLIQQLTSGRQ